MFMPVTVTVERYPGGQRVDRYGEPVAPVTHTERGDWAPRTSRDVRQDGRDGAITGATFYGRPDADIDATDTLLDAAGARWEVDGDIGRWGMGCEVPLIRATG